MIPYGKTFKGYERLSFRYDNFILVHGVSNGRVYNVSHNRVDLGVINLFRVFLFNDLVILFLLGRSCLFITNLKSLNPFGVPDTDDSWHHQSERVAVLDWDILTVHLVCKNNLITRVCGHAHGY